MSDFVFLHPELLWVAPALIVLIVVSMRLVRGLSPWRRRTASLLQSLTVLLLVGVLAQPAFSMQRDDFSMVVLLDGSASVSVKSLQMEVAFAQGVLKDAGPNDRVQFVVAGQSAKQLTPEEVASGAWAAGTEENRATDLASGLRLAGSLLQNEGRRRVVVVSDGWETQGRAQDEAAGIQARGIDVQVVALEALGKPEIVVRSLDANAYARVGDLIQTELSVYSTGDTTATLKVSVDGAELVTQPVNLKAGENRIPLDQKAQAPGFHRIEASVTGGADTSSENNSASATLVVKEQPRVLVLEDRTGEADTLVAALQSSRMTVDRRAPFAIPARLAEMDPYDSVVLYNVAATSMTLDQQRTLQEYVRRNGKGLVVVGGQTSFAKGGYADSTLEEVLPVSSRPGPRPEKGETALILVFDRSSSMDEWMGLSSQDTKFSMAKEAARLAVDALRDGDIFGVVSFDTEFMWSIDPITIHPDTDKEALKNQISNIVLGGGTSIFPALNEATESILKIKAQSKHLVLLTDGRDFHEGDYPSLLAKMRAGNVTLSTIGVGSDADRDLLIDLAKKGQGRYYFTERIQNIPKIVFKELDLTLKEASIVGKVQPHVQDASPVLRGIAPQAIPQLGGYDITTAKPESVTALTADLGQPLLSHWNYGLGRVLAFTSDAGKEWGGDWLAWGDYERFWSEAVRWTMQTPLNRQLQPSITVKSDPATGGTVAHISIESLNSDLGFADLATISVGVRSPSGVITTTLPAQTAPGRYEADVPVGEQGAYEVRLSREGEGLEQSAEIAGFSVPVGAEWANAGANDRLLRRLNNGKSYLIQPAQALDAANLSGAIVEYEPLWFYLVPPALALLILSVAVRRVEFRRRRKRQA